MGRPEEAERAFERALELDRDEAKAILGLAVVAFQRKDLASARGLYEKAIGKDPRLAGDLRMYPGYYKFTPAELDFINGLRRSLTAP